MNNTQKLTKIKRTITEIKEEKPLLCAFIAFSFLLRVAVQTVLCENSARVLCCARINPSALLVFLQPPYSRNCYCGGLLSSVIASVYICPPLSQIAPVI